VQEKATSNVAITDANGRFTLTVQSGAVLQFTFYGFKSIERTAASVNSASPVYMEEDSRMLNEVVLIGYGQVRRGDLTGAITTIGERDFNKGVQTSPVGLMSGKLAGVQITSGGGRPGSGSRIRIRGQSSLGADYGALSDPLIVLDGVPLAVGGRISGLSDILSTINPNDILVFGSYYAINPLNRARMVKLVDYAKSRKAIIYYDPNFRKSHAHEAEQARSSVIANYKSADVIRGSDEDFLNLYGKTDMEHVYMEEVQPYCKRLMTTHGASGVNLFTDTLRLHYDVPFIVPVSTIGAGDNFNAGFIYGLIKNHIGHDDLPSLSEMTWKKLIQSGIDFSTEVCQSHSNYISTDFVDLKK